eukprot:scaffold211433_cov32-Tisochrysis_lutea.AAC.2
MQTCESALAFLKANTLNTHTCKGSYCRCPNGKPPGGEGGRREQDRQGLEPAPLAPTNPSHPGPLSRAQGSVRTAGSGSE